MYYIRNAPIRIKEKRTISIGYLTYYTRNAPIRLGEIYFLKRKFFVPVHPKVRLGDAFCVFDPFAIILIK